MSKEPKNKAQDAAENDELQEFETKHGLKLGEILRDPDTGQILYDELTDEQREDLKRLHESTERMTAAATKTMKAREQLKQQRERLQEDREKIAKAKERAEEGKRYKETIDKYYKSAGQAISTESMQRLSESLGKFMQWFIDEQTGESWRAIIENLKPVSDLVNEIYENREQLDEELKKDFYDGRTVDDYLDNYTASKLLILSRDEDSDLYKALQATRAARAAAGKRTRYTEKTDLVLSTDKSSNLFFSLLAPPSKGSVNGQRQMAIPPADLIPLKYEGAKSKKEITFYYDYVFNNELLEKLGIKGEMTEQDFFVAAILDNMFLAGDRETSLGKIYNELTGKWNPNTRDLDELEKILQRGISTIIYIDDNEVQTAWNKNQKEVNYIFSPVMPAQLVTTRNASGEIQRNRVIINGLSPLFAFSQSIDHITTWPKRVLTAYTGKRTPRYYRILKYLMGEIAWIRNPNSKRSNKITYKELYLHDGAKTTAAKKAARAMMERILDEVFVDSLGVVKSYREDNNGELGIILNCTKNKALPSQKSDKK